MRKFKVGDKIRKIGYDKTCFTIIEERKNVYIVKSDRDIEYHLHFLEEDNYYEVTETENIINISLSSCPNCNGELKNHYSDWAGKEIKKCKSCGWC